MDNASSALDPRLSETIAETFRSLENGQKIVLDKNNQVAVESTGQGFGVAGTSVNSQQVVEHIINAVKEGIKNGNPDISLLDKCRTHPWTKQVLKANPKLADKLLTTEYLYIKELGKVIYAESQKAYMAIEDDIFSDPVKGKSSVVNAKIFDKMVNQFMSTTVSEPDIDIRALQLCRYMQICTAEVNKGNYFGAKSLIASMDNVYLQRMKASFESVPKEITTAYAEAAKLFHPARRNIAIREAITKRIDERRPVIPFTGLHSMAISAAIEINQKNFQKLKDEGNTPREIMMKLGKGGQESDGFKIVNMIDQAKELIGRNTLPTQHTFENFFAKNTVSYSEDELEQFSYKAEPKGTYVPRSSIFADSNWKLGNELRTIISMVKQFVKDVEDKINHVANIATNKPPAHATTMAATLAAKTAAEKASEIKNAAAPEKPMQVAAAAKIASPRGNSMTSNSSTLKQVAQGQEQSYEDTNSRKLSK